MKVLEFAGRSVAFGTEPSQTTLDPTLMVQFQGVTKVYPNETVALTQVDLQVKRGDFLFITGASGAGKSTLLKLICGEERPNQGCAIVDGVDVTKVKGDRLCKLRRRMGIVFQDYKLIPRKTVAENITFALWAQGYNPTEIQRRLIPTLKMVGLSKKAHCFPEQLSGGEQQRVSIARAIAGTPPLLLADEPTGNLDPDNALQILKIFQELHRFGVTILVTTHDEHLVRMADQPVFQLRQGRLQRLRH